MMLRGLSPFLLLTSLVVLAFSGQAIAAKDPDTDPAAELKQVQARLQTLHKQLQADRKQETRVARQLRETEQAGIAIQSELAQLKRRLDKQDSALQELVVQQQVEDSRLAELQSDLARQVRAAYLLGRQGKLRVLFTHDNPATMGRLLAYHRYLYDAHAEGLAAVSAQLDKLAGLEREVSGQQRSLQKLREQRQEQYARLEEQRHTRIEVMQALKTGIGRQGREVSRLEQDEKRLQNLLNSIRQSLSDIPGKDLDQPFGRLKGHLPWPVSGDMQAGFDQRRGLGNLKWRGVLIGTPAGSEVHAVTAGRVAFVDWLRGFGLMVILDHGDSYMSLYGFNQEALVEEGAWVGAGEAIARVGDTGGREKPGLYFELRKGARPLNPASWCKGKPKPARVAVSGS